MGLFKKLAEKAAAGGPDHPAIIAGKLAPGDALIAHGFGMPVAFETDKNVRRRGAIGLAVNIASQKFAEHEHLGGDEGSLAYSVPRDCGGQLVIAVSQQRLTFWWFGVMMNETPAGPLASFDRSQVRSVAPTGGSNQYGGYVRFEFVDDSFIDLSVMQHESFAPFFAAIATFGA